MSRRRSEWLALALLGAACGRSADRRVARDGSVAVAADVAASAPSAVSARAYLPVTEEPVGELPDLAYRPQHDDARYLDSGANRIATGLYIKPLDEAAIAGRVAQLKVDFRAGLGREVGDDELRRWQADMIEDMRRRRLAVRALLDLMIAGEITAEQMDARMQTIHEGLDLAFRRITGLSLAEHQALAGN